MSNARYAENGRINVYVGGDGKLHFVNRDGADTALNFSNEIKVVKTISFSSEFSDDGNYRGHIDISCPGLGTNYFLNKTAFVVSSGMNTAQTEVGCNISFSNPSVNVLRIFCSNRNACRTIRGNIFLIGT